MAPLYARLKLWSWESNLTKLFHATCREAGMTILVQLFWNLHP